MRSILFLLGISLVIAIDGQSQPANTAWRDYVRAIYDSLEEKQFVSLYISKDGRIERAYYCFRENGGAQMVAVNFGDTMFMQLNLDDPKIFQYILTNQKHFRSVITHISSKRPGSWQAQTKKASIHMGVKVPAFHFGHFVKVPESYINDLKRKRLAEGYRAVNGLIDILDEGVKKAFAKMED